ncbi:MAG: acetyltransferase [Sphingobacteriales bacterium 50-39]|nr:ACT domain-containing protein [Sphingobacteriales bacterium]OJW60929.1 MAG: acetyltransferase [Sphingobacteriales bacterium 50-39]
MNGISDLSTLLKTMKPEHNPGDFVFCHTEDPSHLPLGDIILLFKEKEAWTVILDRRVADTQKLPYSFVAAWITLTVHSSLQAVGLTAAFARALADHNISCNVVAAYYHDHIFVDKTDIDKAMSVLHQLSQ